MSQNCSNQHIMCRMTRKALLSYATERAKKVKPVTVRNTLAAMRFQTRR